MIAEKDCENSMVEYSKETTKKILTAGPIVLWCGDTPNKFKPTNVYMTVSNGTENELSCELFKDSDCSVRLGQLQIKKCKGISSDGNDKHFAMQLHVSEKAGLLFESETLQGAEKTIFDYLQEPIKKTLASGPIELWFGVSPTLRRKVKVFMSVADGQDDPVCSLFRDTEQKFSFGQFSMKNCKVVTSESNDKRFEVQSQVSERAGLMFESATKEDAEEWKAVLLP